jgi:hypothetical protein
MTTTLWIIVLVGLLFVVGFIKQRHTINLPADEALKIEEARKKLIPAATAGDVYQIVGIALVLAGIPIPHWVAGILLIMLGWLVG